MAIRLPSYIAPSAKLNRPEAGKLNELKTQSQDITFSGYNEVVPVVYGEQIVAGPIIAGPPTGAVTSLRYAIAITYVGDAPVEGITHVIVNGVKHEAPAIPSADTPAVFTKEGVSFRIYNGMQAVVDSTLKTTFGASFDDSFTGVAYAVITIPQNQSTSIEFDSAVKFVVRGKKCLDPRDNVKRWTENPSLHLADYVTDPNCLGRGIEGEIDCADWNDSLYSGLPRARTGLTINAALKAEDILDLMCTYAECLWSYEGESVRVIPDKPIDSAADVIGAKQTKGGTLTFTGSNQDQIPTAVSIFFSDRDVEAEWGALPARAQIAEHEVFGTVSSLSDVQMPGVYRRIEAERRAWQRLIRLQSPGKIAWQMYAVGIQYQAGDVVRLPDIKGLTSMRVRLIAQPEMVTAGMYQMHAEPYKSDDYPAHKSGGNIPVGGVLLQKAGATVDGYTDISTAESLPIYGVGLSDDTGVVEHSGQLPTGVISFQLLPAGQHDFKNVTVAKVVPGSGHALGGNVAAPPHTHSGSLDLTAMANSDAVSKEVYRLVRKDAGGTNQGFESLRFFAADDIPSEGVVEQLVSSGLYISSGFSVGVKQKNESIFVQSSESGRHDHYEKSTAVSGGLNHYSVPRSDASNKNRHPHTVSGSRAQRLKSVGVALYSFAEIPLIPTGGIIGFVGSMIPTGWALCDGANGTPNLVGYFAQLKQASDAGSVEEDESTLSVIFPTQSTSSANRHTHQFSTAVGNVEVDAQSHSITVEHEHQINIGPQTRNYNYTPKRFALRFIQYKGD